MIATEIYRPELWRDFFVMVGGGSAALTGLVFVAISLNLCIVAGDPTHRYRAIGTLSGFAAVFMICALALMGEQGHVAIGIEWATVAALAGIVFVYGYIQAQRQGGTPSGLYLNRVLSGAVCYSAEVLGGVALALGHLAGLYVAAVAMVAYFPFLISGAWLLVIGIHVAQSETRPS